jgi:TRAP-type mannitol/chloroaromatic compound transport system permease small subunit
MQIFNNGIVIGLCLAVVDIISMGITKQINIGGLNSRWLIFACILYGGQMLIFNYGLHLISMTVLNLTWNLFSNVVITLIGLYYFKENITHLETYGILFGLFALFLFGLSEYTK